MSTSVNIMMNDLHIPKRSWPHRPFQPSCPKTSQAIWNLHFLTPTQRNKSQILSNKIILSKSKSGLICQLIPIKLRNHHSRQTSHKLRVINHLNNRYLTRKRLREAWTAKWGNTNHSRTLDIKWKGILRPKWNHGWWSQLTSLNRTLILIYSILYHFPRRRTQFQFKS